jgi:hypothetical protein
MPTPPHPLPSWPPSEASIVDSTPGTTADTKVALVELHAVGPTKLFDTGERAGGRAGERAGAWGALGVPGGQAGGQGALQLSCRSSEQLCCGPPRVLPQRALTRAASWGRRSGARC